MPTVPARTVPLRPRIFAEVIVIANILYKKNSSGEMVE